MNKKTIFMINEDIKIPYNTSTKDLHYKKAKFNVEYPLMKYHEYVLIRDGFSNSLNESNPKIFERFSKQDIISYVFFRGDVLINKTSNEIVVFVAKMLDEEAEE